MDQKKSALILNHDGCGQRPPDLSRRFFLSAAIVLLSGLFLFLEACDKINGTGEKETMAMTKINSVPSLPIPPIDASAPAKTETATFGLG